MERLEYSKTVLEHFRNPRNVGELEDADAVGTVGNPVCGDMMELSIRVEDNRITDIKFRTFGCASAIATTSMLTEMVKGKTLEEAEKLSWDDVVGGLEGLPPVKVHCSLLAVDGLKKALYEYYKSRGIIREDLNIKGESEHEEEEAVKESGPLV
ncbi:MAG TPA: iron-sulfur cluster assembly scaffold protein [Euryarchaeota archaeon]|nr:MAG: iron-sulfur cluster assembly scaffold protein [Thermoplasmatales archaeon ex4484_6]RLF69504.1 MAG: iron-sulfur cluster assembly scaffold protein [Thermoplasmata archaeon]HHD16136.1 iron-sulfur cluster assembly scaffold protein [Euryarchaeota archaeon]